MNNTIKNLDGQDVVDTHAGRFLLPFSEEQQLALEHLLENGISIAGLAYTDISVEMLDIIIFNMYPNRFTSPEKYDDLQIWKFAHTRFTKEQAEMIAKMWYKHPSVGEHIEDFVGKEPSMINFVCEASDLVKDPQEAYDMLKKYDYPAPILDWYLALKKKVEKRQRIKNKLMDIAAK